MLVAVTNWKKDSRTAIWHCAVKVDCEAGRAMEVGLSGRYVRDG